MNVDLFGNPKPVELAEEPSPRGLLDDGLVRTTGWLQFSTQGVRSEVVCALIFLLHGLVIAVALVASNPVLAGITALAAAPCGWALWRLTTQLRPASRARNTHTIEARHLAPADWVRLHGSIGPVGRVASVTTPDGDQDLDVRFAGGTRMNWPADHQVHVVELLD